MRKLSEIDYEERELRLLIALARYMREFDGRPIRDIEIVRIFNEDLELSITELKERNGLQDDYEV